MNISSIRLRTRVFFLMIRFYFCTPSICFLQHCQGRIHFGDAASPTSIHFEYFILLLFRRALVYAIITVLSLIAECECIRRKKANMEKIRYPPLDITWLGGFLWLYAPDPWGSQVDAIVIGDLRAHYRW